MKPSPIPQYLTPGTRVTFNTSMADSNLATSIPKLMLLGQRLAAHIEPVRFQGGTLNDCTIHATAAYTGAVKKQYIIEIDATGTPDTFKWSNDGGATYTTGVSITGGAQTLEAGVIIVFAATTAHALADQWKFAAIPAGTVAQAIPTEIFSVDEAREKCGQGSMVHYMASAALKQAQAYRLFFCSLNDSGSNKAAGSVTITGPATVAGSLSLTIGSRRAEIAIAVGDTAAEISIALGEKLMEILDLPATCNENTATPGKIDVIAKNAGTIGNQIEMVYELTGAAGVTVTLVQPTSGSTDPDSDTALTAIYTGDYDRYVFPWNSAAEIAKLVTHLNNISAYDQQRPATAYVGAVDSIANLQTLAAGANSGRVIIIGQRGGRDVPYELAAKFAARLAVKAGADAASGMNKEIMIGANAPTLDSNRFSQNEIETLLESGITPLTEEKGTNNVIVVREVTTSLTVGGTPTTELREGNTLRILDYARKDIVAQLDRIFIGTKNITSVQNAIVETVADRMRLMETEEKIRDAENNIANITIAVDGSDANRVNLVVPITPVSLLHAIAIEMVVFL